MKTSYSIAIFLLLTLNIVNAQWQKANGPFHADIKALVQDGNNLFAVGQFQGVFLSTDNGSNWTALNNSLPLNGPTNAYNSLVINASSIYVGTNNGIFLSSDNGANWSAMNNGLPLNTWVYSFLIDGNNIFIGTNKGVFLLDNNGTTWESVNTGFPAGVVIRSMVKSGSNLYAGTTNGVYTSNDNGNNWTAVNNGLTSFIYSLAIEGNTIYAGTSDGMFLSTDNGNNWSEINNGLPISAVTHLTLNGTAIYAGTFAGLFISTDNGNSWTSIKGDGINQVTSSSTNAIIIDGNNILAGGNDGISLSNDNGDTWNYQNDGLPFATILNLATNGEIVYVSSEKGLYSTEDNGNSWSRVFNRFTSSVKARNANVYIGSNFGNVYVSNDYGNDWTLGTGFGDNGQDVFAVSGSTVFAKYNVGLFTEGNGYVSTDNGISFSAEDYPYQIFANRDENILFAIDSIVWSYTDNDWTAVSSVISNAPVYSLATNASRFFVGTDGGIFKSHSDASSWNKIEFGSANAMVTSIAANGQNLYACTSNNEIYSSTNNGSTWMAITDNFTDTIISKPYGFQTTQLLINNTHIFIASEEGIWTRPLSEVTNINEPISDAQFSLYPNPTSGRFSISGEEINSVVIYNILGKRIYSTASVRTPSIEVDLSNTPAGVYFVTINSEGKNYSKKIMIQ